VAYIGKIGVDEFGDALMVFLGNEFIDVTNVIREQGTKTTLAFVAVDKDAKPEFRFYRDNAADISLRRDEISGVQPTGFSLYHAGGIVLAEEPSASTYARLVDRFYESDVPISLDPTVRRSLISDPDRYLALLLKIIEKVTILKVSDEELQFLTGSNDFDQAIKVLPLKKGALTFVTLGRAGSSVYRDGVKISQVPGFSVKVAETTGCGDCFMASTLAQLAGSPVADLATIDGDRLASVMRFANAAAAIVATRIGAAEANPTRAEVEKFLQEQ
jgi:fructokinase